MLRNKSSRKSERPGSNRRMIKAKNSVEKSVSHHSHFLRALTSLRKMKSRPTSKIDMIMSTLKAIMRKKSMMTRASAAALLIMKEKT